MNEPLWVLPKVVIAVHQMLLAQHGGLLGIRDEALLDSALNRPKQRFAYDNDFSIFDLAASYSYGLAKNHPFMDGNKRIALSVGAIFLELNGYSLNAPEAETVVIFEQLAAGDLTEEDLANWFKVSSIQNA
ncbi:MAG: type II toxin-antitoxin system death-on-curing family toxin [Methylococcales bacterium]